MSVGHVVITGGDGDLAGALAREFRGAGYEVDAPGRERLDVCAASEVDRFFQSRPCSLLICCAGVLRDVLLARSVEADWNAVWRTHYLGAKACAEAVLPGMARNGVGHILFLSSHSALHPPPGQAAYATAKRALLGLTRDMAVRHGPSNIRINAILPGFLDNRMTAKMPLEQKDEVRGKHALGRLNTMDRVASFARFLHEAMPHTSGQWFQLDSRESMI